MSYIIESVYHCPIKDIKKLKVISKFGPRTFYNKIAKKYESGHHNGIDLVGNKTIICPYDGLVTKTCNNVKGYSEKYPCGNYVTIDHNNGFKTVYYHLKLDSIKVKKGQKIKAGTELGIMGNTGHATDVHLHYGIKKNNKWVDPENFLRGKETMGVNIEIIEVNQDNKNDFIIYKVKKGDNLTKIAKKYGTTWKTIYNDNKNIIGNNPNLIYPNQELLIRIN